MRSFQERPLRKLPRVRLPSPDLKTALKQSGEHYRTTMALKLDDILSRKGVGAWKVDHEAFVEGVSPRHRADAHSAHSEALESLGR